MNIKNTQLLFVTPTFPPAINGLAHTVYAYAKTLQEMGYDVEVFTAGVEDYVYNGIKVSCLPLFGSFSLRSPLKGDISKYKTYLVSRSDRLAICHAFQSAVTDLALAYFPGKKIYHSHGVSWRSEISHSRIRGFLRRISYFPYEVIGPFLLKRANAAIFLGHRSNSDRTFDSKYFRDRLSAVIPNASFLPPGMPREYNSKLKLLAVGSCTREKGFDRLAKMLNDLNGEHIHSLTVCTLESSPFLNEFIELIGRVKSFPINIVYGKTGDTLGPFYSDADVLLNFSSSECYPLIMADAVNARLPTFCFDTGYQCEIRGAKIFNRVEQVVDYLNDFSSHVVELRRLSNDTVPRMWREAGIELAEFIKRV